MKRVFNLCRGLISLVLSAVAGVFWLIGAAVTVVRVAIALTLFAGLGAFVDEDWPDDPPQWPISQETKPKGAGWEDASWSSRETSCGMRPGEQSVDQGTMREGVDEGGTSWGSAGLGDAHPHGEREQRGRRRAGGARQKKWGDAAEGRGNAVLSPCCSPSIAHDVGYSDAAWIAKLPGICQFNFYPERGGCTVWH